MNKLEQVWNTRIKQTSPSLLKGRRVFCAYNSFIDRQVFITEDEIQPILDETNAVAKKPERVASTKGFAEALLYHFSKGIGGHVQTTYEFSQWLGQHFHRYNPRVGGQAGIIASQLAQLGTTSILYAPVQAKDAFDLLDSRVLFPANKNDCLQLMSVRKAAKAHAPEKINWIFEFKRGQKLRLGSKTITCPYPNRLILSTPFPRPPYFSHETQKILPALAKQLDCAIIAGHHYLKPEYADGRTFQYYLDREEQALKRMKKANPRLRVHLEYVPFGHKEIERAALKHAAANADSFGLNEHELIEVCEKIGARKEAKALCDKHDSVTCYKGVLAIMKKLHLQRVHMHALGYNLVVLNKRHYSSATSTRNACMLGSRSVTTKAMLGREFTLKELAVSEKERVSTIGLKQLHLFASKTKPGKQFEQEGIADFGDHWLVLAPAPLHEAKAGTVGLGDVVSSIAFVAEA